MYKKEYLMKFKYYEGTITTLCDNQYLVFGSNLAGRHGKGAALYAKKNFGAVYGDALGFTGKCFAIPTKDENIVTMPLYRILASVSYFSRITHLFPAKEFLVTKVGTGLAGYEPQDIAPMFRWCNPANTIFDIAWKEHLE
jgi:hypothetical protein